MIQLAKQLFVFNLIVSGNYVGETFACNIQELFSNNMYVKHLLGFMTMYFFVVFLEGDNVVKPLVSVYTTIGLYLWFVMITRTSRKYTLIVMVLIFLIYALNNTKEYLEKTKEENENNNEVNIERINKLNTGLFVTASLLTLYAFVLYIGEKKVEYSKNWSWLKFIVGTANCKGNIEHNVAKMSEMSLLGRAFA